MICFVKLNPFMSSLSISQLNPCFLHKTRKWFQRRKLVVNIIFCRIARIEQFLSKFERFKIGVSENTKELAVGCIVVTGANRGIGLELCRQFKASGKRVVAVCRSDSEELSALGIETLQGFDLADSVERNRLIAELGLLSQDEPLDMLINNAGILRKQGIGDLSETVLSQQQLLVNAVAPICLAEASLPY